MYVVFELNGRQYDGLIGQKVTVDLLSGTDKTVKIDKILLCKKDENEVLIGKPYVQGAEVIADVRENFKDSKVIVYKYKKRKNYRRKKGHRQQYTVLFLNTLKTPGFSIESAKLEEARKQEAAKWAEAHKKAKEERAKKQAATAPAVAAAQSGHAPEKAAPEKAPKKKRA